MYQSSDLLFIFVETPLHAGTGRGLGVVDQPIQRERVTEYPMVQSSSVKGKLRALANKRLPKPEVETIFGPENPDANTAFAGALASCDASVLLFPVRSLQGVFAWVTSPDVLERFRRSAAMAGIELPPEWAQLGGAEPGPESAWVGGSQLAIPLAGEARSEIVLEDYSFTPDTSHAEAVRGVGEWLAAHALPEDYAWWKEALPGKLVILNADNFRDFALYSTEVQTHIRLNPDKKTAEGGALWTSESLPADTLLVAPLLATDARNNHNAMKAGDILDKVSGMELRYVQMGGDETTGQGMVSLRIYKGKRGQP